MKIQKISNNLPRTNNLQQQQQNIKTNSNGTTPISNADNLMFMGSKIDLVKRVMLKPAAQNLDEAMVKSMQELNISSSTLVKKLTPKIQTGQQAQNKLNIEAGAYTQTLIAKINATENRIKNLEEALATEAKPADVSMAEFKIEYCNSWNDSVEKAKYEAIANKARNEERAKYWSGFKWMSDGEKKYNEAMRPYWDKHDRFQRFKNSLPEARKLIADYNTQKSNKREVIASLKREKAAYIAELTSAHLGDFVNHTLNQKGGIADRIAGYSDVKEQIQKVFVTPLIASKKDPSVSMPNAIVLYGATGVGKTEMLRGIEQESKEVANIVHFPMDTPPKDFPKVIASILSDARNRYIKENKRTILLIDEAEKYMCMSPNQAKRLGSEFEPDDFDVLNYCGQESGANVRYLKSLLDRISESPKIDDLDKTKSGTTLFITTNYPHLIDQDLMRRKGKFTPIAVHPAENSNLKAVISHYFNQHSQLLEQIKLLAPQANFANILNGQIRFSPKAKNVLIEKRNNGTINNMFINPELSDWPNLERFIKFMNPSDKRGAYSNVEIKDMISRAFDRYLENPTQPMYKYFFEVKDETLRDITPQRYSKFKTIYSMVNDKVSTDDLGDAQKEFVDLIHAYQNGELNDEMCKTVEKQMERIKKELEKLEELKKKGIAFNEGEQAQYDLFKMWDNMWE